MKAMIRVSAAILIGAALFFVLSDTSEAAYKIILNNGSEFTVDSYEKAGDEVRIEYGGGVIGIKQKEIQSIRATRDVQQTKKASPAKIQQPAKRMEKFHGGKSPYQEADVTGKEQKREEQQDRLNTIIKNITNKQEELKSLKDERMDLVDRIASLKEEAKKRAIANYRDPAAAGLYYLPAADRQWLLENEPKVSEFDAKIKNNQDDLSALLAKKDDLDRRMEDIK